MIETFSLHGRPIVVTGAAGLLGRNHCFAIAEAGGVPVLFDIDAPSLSILQEDLSTRGFENLAMVVDSTDEKSVSAASQKVHTELGPVFGIVNNVASNPPMGIGDARDGRLETYSYSEWKREHDVALGSAFLIAKYFGAHLVERGTGSIVNVASDLAVISPDQRLYESSELPQGVQPKKPMSYSSTKTAVLGITRYLATYWSPLPIRSNALVPGSVDASQSQALKERIKERIPLDRLASEGEYKGAIVFLLSDASSYMNGASLVMDGGRSIW